MFETLSSGDISTRLQRVAEAGASHARDHESRSRMREICTSGSLRGGGSMEGMGSLNGHEAGNGGHGQGEPTATRFPRLLDQIGDSA